MNDELEKRNINHYDGNGWSKYQLMVLQQLDDHNKVLQNLNREIVDIKQMYAVSETELKMWRSQVMTSINELTEQHDHMLYDEKGIANRLYGIERALDVEEQTTSKIKSTWALYGAVILFIMNVAVQIFQIIYKH